jgi:nitrate reductase beta subunit
MLFYVPPLSPVMHRQTGETVTRVSDRFFHEIDDARVPMQFLANLFGGGQTEPVRYALRKQMAVRTMRRQETVGDQSDEVVAEALGQADSSMDEAEAIYRLTSLCTFDERFVIPPSHREFAIEAMKDTHEHKQEAGFGFIHGPRRGK